MCLSGAAHSITHTPRHPTQPLISPLNPLPTSYSTGPSNRRTGYSKCPKGHYCNRGRAHKCPAGRYGDATGLTNPDCSGPCAGGYVCPEGSTVATHTLCGKGLAGTYGARELFCPPGSTEVFRIGHEYLIGGEASRRGATTAATLTASGHLGSDASYAAESGRLNSRAFDAGGGATRAGCWAAPSNKADTHHLDISTAAPHTVKGVITQACDCRDCAGSSRHCVTAYRVRYKDAEAGEWKWVDGGKVFSGNSCPSGSAFDTRATSYFSTPVVTSEVQLWPRSWQGRVAMRAELIGQSENGITTPVDAPGLMKTGWAPCPPGGDCVEGEDRRVRVKFDDLNCKSTGKDTVHLGEETAGGVALKEYTATGEGPAAGYTFTVTRVPPTEVVPGVNDLCPPGEVFTMVAGGQLQLKTTAPVADGINYEGCNYLDVEIKVVEDDNTDTCAVRVQITDLNDVPVMHAGQSREVSETAERNEAFGDPLEASDPDVDQSLLFAITGGNVGDAFKISRCSGQLAVNNPVLDYEDRASYTLTVSVTDDGGLDHSAVVNIAVLNANDPPVFGGATAFTTSETTVGSCKPVACSAAATDPEGGVVTYAITRQDQPEAFAITAAGELTVTHADTLNFEAKTAYILLVTATDEDGAETEGEFTINIANANEAPLVDLATFEVPEDAPNGFVVGQVTARDPDDDALPMGQSTFALTGGNPGGVFAIDTDGYITVANAGGLDHETAAQYTVTVRVSDASPDAADRAPTDAEFLVFVTDVNEVDTVADVTFTIAEDVVPASAAAVVGEVLVATQDVGQLYTFTAAGAGTSHFEVDALSGAVRLTTGGLDFESGTTSFVFTVTATDNGAPSALSDTGTVTVQVLDVAEPPYLTSTAMSVPENVPAGTVVGTLTAVDPEGAAVTFTLVDDDASGGLDDGEAAPFAIGGNQLVVASQEAMNHEARPVREVTVEMSDGSETARGVVTVAVTNVEENPVLVANPVRSIAETAPVGTVVQGGPVQAFDPEGENMKLEILGGNTNAAFAVKEETMEIYLNKAGVLDYNTKPEYVLNCRVATDSSSTGYTLFDVTILVADDNEPPVIADGQAFTIPESAGVNHPVGAVAATEEDVGQTLSWAVEGTSFFKIDATGQLFVTAAAALSFEDTATYSFGVRVTDDGSPTPLSDVAEVTVSLSDVNEAPVALDATLTIPENAAAGTVLGAVSASDPDTTPAFNTLTYALASVSNGGDADGGLFAVDAGTGRVTLARAALDFEIVPDYALVVRVTDPQGLEDAATITVNVLNTNDAPELPSVAFSVVENTVPGAAVGQPLRAFDQEANTQSLSYTVTGANCWRATGVGAAPRVWPAPVAVAGEVAPLRLRVATTSHAVVYLLEEDNLLAPYYKLEAGIPSTPPVMSKLWRCMPQADGSGNLCEVVSAVATPALAAGVYGADALVDLWVTVATLPAAAAATPTVEVDRGTRVLTGDASADVVRVDVDGAPLLDGPRTMMGWVRPATLSASSSAVVIPFSFGAGDSATCNKGWALALGATQAHVLAGCDEHALRDVVTAGDAATAYAALWATPQPAWHHVAVTYAGAGGDVVLFVDGETVGGASGAAVAAASPFATEGGYMLGSWPDNSNVFAGGLRDVRFYAGQALTPSQVAAVVAGTDRVVEVELGVGAAPSPSSSPSPSPVATFRDDASPVAPPVVSRLGVGTAAGSTATFTSVCFDTSPPSAMDLLALHPATGALTTRVAPDFETRAAYSFEVTVTDSGTPALSDTAVVAVTITDLNEEPWFERTGDCISVASGGDGGGDGGGGASSSSAADVFTGCFEVAEIRDPAQAATGAPWVVGRILADDEEDTPAELTLSLASGNVQGAFAIDPHTGVVTVANPAALNFEQAPYNLFHITVEVEDTGGRVAASKLHVTVTDVNEAPRLPQAMARAVKEMSGAGVAVGAPVAGSDVDGGVFGALTYALAPAGSGLDDNAGVDVADAGVTDAPLFEIDPVTAQLRVTGRVDLDYESRDTYVLALTVTDGGGLSAAANVTVTLLDVNEYPSLADITVEVRENSPVATVVGDPLVATDPDIGQFLLYTMTRSAVAADDLFRLGACSGQLEVAVAALDFETKNEYTLAVTVTDDGVDPYHLSDEATVTVVVLDVNEPPEIDDATVTVAENTAPGTAFGEALQGRDVDAGQTLTYSLQEPRNDGGAIVIDPALGRLQVLKDTLDYEALPEYTITVRVDDDGVDPHPMHATAVVTVLLEDVNEDPVIPAGQVLSVPENSAVGTATTPNVKASDPDAGDTITLSMAPHDALVMDAAGVVRVANQSLLDHEAADHFDIEVTVTDSGGRNATAVVTVLVEDVNEAPVFPDTTLRVPELSAIGTLVGDALPATDVDDGQSLTYTFASVSNEFGFASAAPDRIEVRMPGLDFEATPAYTFSVRVTDNGFPPLSTAATVTVEVEDVNEAPWLADVTFSLPENVHACTATHTPGACACAGGTARCIGEPLVGGDVDAGDTLSYAIVDDGGAGGVVALDTDRNTLYLVPCATWADPAVGCLNHEATPSYTVTVAVTDAAGLNATGTVTVLVEDVNEAPVVAGGQTRSLPEKLTLEFNPLKPNKLSVGPRVVATDVDDGDDLNLRYYTGPCTAPLAGELGLANCSALPFALAGNDDRMFSVRPTDGQIVLRDPTSPRYVVDTVIELTVMVADPAKLLAAAVVTITVTNVNDQPAINGTTTFALPENASAGAVAATHLDVSDDDDDQGYSFALVSASPFAAMDLFTVDAATGAITLLAAALDHEAMPIYTLEVRVTDDHPQPLSSSTPITIHVTNINEAPTVAGPVAVAVEENSVAVELSPAVTATDPDKGDVLTFTLETFPTPGGATHPFSINATSGVVAVAADAALDYETTEAYTFTVRVADGHSPALSDTTTLHVAVLGVNEACEIHNPAATFTVVEGVPVATVVGVVNASDVDAFDDLTYTVNDQPYFDINAAGEIYTLVEMDYEEAVAHTLTVTVTDDGRTAGEADPLSCAATYHIQLVDVDDVTLVGFSSTGTLGAGVAPFTTAGGEFVYLHGTNFGPRTLASTAPGDATTVTATYGRQRVDEYTARDCVVVPDPHVERGQVNTLIRCTTAPGTGRDMVWAVTINGGTPGVKGGAGAAASADVPTAGVTRYATPTIARVDGAAALGTAGGDPLTLHGADFGEAGTFVEVRYGPEGSGFLGQACEVSAASPHTVIECLSAPGVGADLAFHVEIDSQVSPVHTGADVAAAAGGPRTYRYTPPALGHMTGTPQLSTAGGEAITFHGSNFGAGDGIAAGVGVPGLSGAVVVAYENEDGYAYLMADCAVSTPHVAITCHSAPGVGRDHRFVVTVGGQVSSPVVEPEGEEGEAGDGGAGEAGDGGAGDGEEPARRRVLAEGDGEAVEEAGEEPAAPKFYKVSYAPPVVLDVRGPGSWRAATVGGQEVTVLGKHFGPLHSVVILPANAGTTTTTTVGNPVLAEYGRVAGEGEADAGTWTKRYDGVACVVTVAHTQLRCQTAPGTGKGYAWRVNVGRQYSGVFTGVLTSYAPPVIINFQGLGAVDADTEGNELVRVEGRQFGTMAADAIDVVTYGKEGTEYTADCHVSADHEEITCLTAQGAGLELKWRVVVDGQASVTPTTEYAPPDINATTSSAPGVDVDALLSDGGQAVTLLGDDFGPPQSYLDAEFGPGVTYLESVTYGPTGIEYAAAGCKVVDHDQIDCETVPGVGENLQWRAVVKGQSSVLSTDTVSYGRPTIRAMSTNHAVTDGGTNVTITGENFGLLDATADVSVRFGDATLTPTGTRVGEVNASAGPGTPAPHFVDFAVPEGQGVALDVQVMITDATGAVYGSDTREFNYDAPHIDTIVPEQHGARARYLVVEGRNFGTFGTVSVSYKDNGQTHVVQLQPAVWEHTRVEATFNNGKGTLTVTRGDGVASNAVYFKQKAPSISNLCGREGENPVFGTAGGDDLTISVNNIGSRLQDIAVTVGGLPCNVTRLVNLTAETKGTSECSRTAVVNSETDLAELTCLVPEGMGIDKNVVILRNNMTSRLGVYVDYKPPTVTDIWPALVSTQGGDWVTVTGTNLGFKHIDTQLNHRIGTLSSCEIVVPHTVARCAAPAGEGVPATAKFLITYEDSAFVSQRWDYPGDANVPLAARLKLGYFPPNVTAWPATLPTHGGKMVLEGTNFGRAVAAGRAVEVVDAAGALVAVCTPTLWSHTRIECDLSDGDGKDLFIVVAVDGQASPLVPFRFAAPVVTSFFPKGDTTRGGTVMTVLGDSFGLAPAVALGAYSPTPAQVLSVNHTALVFLVPEGAGADLQVVVTANGQRSADRPADVFSYDPPRLTAMSLHSAAGALLRDVTTTGGDIVTLEGVSLSRFDAQVVLTGGRILDPTRCAAGNITCNRYGRRRVMEWSDLASHDHERVTFAMPEGMGTNISVHMVVGGRASIEWPRLRLDYRPPAVDRVTPDISHARGDHVDIIGLDFGENDDPRNHIIAVTINGEPCADLEYVPRRTTPSYSKAPQLRCRTPPMVVGWKDFEVHTARQTDAVRGSCNGTAKCELMRTECEAGSYGEEGEWCLPCPRGARCVGALTAPVSKKEWWMQNGTAEDCPAADSAEAEELASYLEALQRFYTGSPLTFRKVDADTGRLKTYPTEDDLCYDHATICSITHCQRLYSGERQVAPMAVPCDPQWACTGNNTCAVGYAGWRCSTCDSCFQANPGDKCRRYYKRAGECVECPDNPWILILGFLLMVIVLIGGAVIVNKKELHLPFLSIGVDYFQVLAIFANSRVQWPPLIKEIFHMMSVFNLNLEITAPECSIPDLGYYTKWMVIEALPLAAVAGFLTMHITLLVYKKCILCRSGKATGHVNNMIGSLFLMLYYLYLYITRTTLDVFNCSPTDPYDGYTYLTVVFERCWEPGGLHLRLLPYAVVTFLMYTVAYPLAVFLILRRFRFLVMEDQLLFAQGKGKTRLTNPHAYHIRKRFKKLYYHFKPDYYYWILIVIARKFLIAFTALMFTKNAAFQLSISLLIVFTSYVLQVKNRPYLSMTERDAVLRDHQRRAVEDGPGSTHALLAQNLGNISLRDKKVTRSVFGMSSRQVAARRAAEQAASFIWNYNTVEAVLLCCAVLVNLSGIMFESGQFDSEYYQEQRNMVSYFVLFVIAFSVTYFGAVLISEVRATLCPTCCRRKETARKAAKSARKSMRRGSSAGSMGGAGGAGGMMSQRNPAADMVQMATNAKAAGSKFANPMFSNNGDGGAGGDGLSTVAEVNDTAEVAALREALKAQSAEVERLTAELRNFKLRDQREALGKSGGAKSGGAKSGGRDVSTSNPVAAARRNRKRVKNEFSGVRASSSGSGAGGAGAGAGDSPSRLQRSASKKEFLGVRAGAGATAGGRGRANRRRRLARGRRTRGGAAAARRSGAGAGASASASASAVSNAV